MGYRYNSTGVKMPGGQTIPEEEYVLEIVDAKEGKSKKGDYQVKVDFKVASGVHVGFEVKYHYVTFQAKDSKGAGMAVHFIKSIGEPWEGEFEISPENWIGKKLMAYLSVEEYNGYHNMKASNIKPYVVGQTETDQAASSEEEVPF